MFLMNFCWFVGYDIPMWSCDFDHGLCHWMQMKDDDVDWESQAGGVNGIYDHTRSNGKCFILCIFILLRY